MGRADPLFPCDIHVKRFRLWSDEEMLKKGTGVASRRILVVTIRFGQQSRPTNHRRSQIRELLG